MNTDTSVSEQGAGGPQRDSKFTLAVVLALACVFALVLSVDATLMTWVGVRLYVWLIAVAPGLLVALGCFVVGDLIWGRKRIVPQLGMLERILLSFSCGMGLLSCLVLVDSNEGIDPFHMYLVTLGAGFALYEAVAARWRSRNESRDNHVKLQTLPLTYLSIIPAALLALLVAMVMLVSLTPPIIFDVTEYHLGAWTDYSQQSDNASFVPMPHNFYARFPFPIESLYYLGLAITPANDGAPKVFNALCVLACAALAGLMARRLGGGRNASMLAALVTLAHSVMLDVSIDAMIDAPVALLVAASMYAGCISIGAFGAAPAPRLIFPATLLFGSALAAKYTVAQIFLLPWLALVLWPMLRQNWRRPKLVFWAGVLSLIPCLFWLGKNVVFYGNPLEPFFVKWFRPGDVAGIAREKFYIESHFPQSPLTAEYWTSLLPRLGEYKWVLLVACAGWMFRGRNAAVVRIVLFAAGAWLLWNLVRESQNRFLLPAMVLLAPVAATGALAFPHVALRRTVAAVLVLFAATQTVRYALTVHQSAAVDYVLDFAPGTRFDLIDEEGNETPRAEFYETNLGDLGRAVNDVARMWRVPAGFEDTNKLLHIYEARPYLFPVNEQLYNVVWDDSVLLDIIRPATNVDEARQLLREAGVTHVLVNRQELVRYIQQYARPAQLRRLGVRPGEDPRMAWSATSTPQDLYPPFYRDPDWQRLRPMVNQLLADFDENATIRHGGPAPGAGVLPLDITVGPVP